MKDISIGCDIVNINRFRKINYRENHSFYRRWFKKNEIESCLSKPDPYSQFALLFAIKESIIKTSRDLNLEQIEVTGRNSARLNGKKSTLDIRASVKGQFAVAFVVKHG